MSVDWSWVYSEAKGWQAAIGSVLGFLALIAGALFNYRLNRLRDKRLRLEEVIAVSSAVYGEIILQRRSVARLANAVATRYFSHGTGEYRGEPFDKHFISGISLPPLSVYPSIVGKIGILPGELALSIVTFYARIEQVETWLPRLQDDKDRPFSYGVKYVIDPAIEAVLGIQPALSSIERMASILHPEAIPNVDKALSAQEFEEEMLAD